MANEAVIIELFNGGRPIRYTCANGTGIEKGTLMELTLAADRTVTAFANNASACVGVAAEEKVANSGITEISVYTDGIFDILTDAGNDNAGVMLANNGTANTGETADAADMLASANIGYLLEQAIGAEVCAVRINK